MFSRYDGNEKKKRKKRKKDMILNVYYASRASSEICYGNTRGIKAISDSRSRIQILLSSCNNIINSLSGERKQEWYAPLLDTLHVVRWVEEPDIAPW